MEGRLLQLGFCFCTEDSHRQVVVCSECCSMSDHCDSEVRAWSVTANAWWPALADCSSEAAVQARCDGPSLSSTPGSKISRRLCQNAEFLGRQHLWSASRRQLSVPRVRPQHVWKPSYFSRLTNSPEFTARLFTRSSCFRRDLKMHLFTGAWGVFYVIVRYRLTFTYFLFYPQYFDYSGIP